MESRMTKNLKKAALYNRQRGVYHPAAHDHKQDAAVTAERIRTERKEELFYPAPGQDVHATVYNEKGV